MWRLRKNNLLVNEKDKLFVHKIHLERLLHAKTHIENKGPETPYFMKNKLSKKEIMRVKEKKRCYENNIIFSRLLAINNTFSPYSKINKPQYCPALDKIRHNFDKIERQNDIYKNNQLLFKKLLKEKSFYPRENYFNLYDYENYLKNNIKKKIDNPNLKFATFNQFKKNIIRNYSFRRSNSMRMSNKSFMSRNSGRFDINKFNRECKSNFTFGIPQNKSYNNLIGMTGKKNKNNSNASYNSTMLTSKMGRNLSRCQSAFNIMNRNNNNLN